VGDDGVSLSLSHSLPLPEGLRSLAQALRPGRPLSDLGASRLPRGVFSRCAGDEVTLHDARIQLTEASLQEGLDVLWLCAEAPDLSHQRTRALLVKGAQLGGAQVQVFYAQTLSALPELLIALLSARVAPLILYHGPPSGVCERTDQRVTDLTLKLPRLCLMAGGTVIMMSDSSERSAVNEALERSVWSEVSLDR